MEDTNIQFFVKDNVPTITISGNVIGEAPDHGRIVFMENQDLLNIERIRDLQNKIFLGFQNIVGITQQNIFHNININDNKVIFSKYSEDHSSNIVNNSLYLLNDPDSTTTPTTYNPLKFSNIYKYFPDLHLQNNPTVSLNLENFIEMSILQTLFEIKTYTLDALDPKKLIYKITNFTEIAPLMLFGGGKQLHQNATHTLSNPPGLTIENIRALQTSLRMEIYYDIYYDMGYECNKATGRWSKTDLLLKSGETLDFTIMINDQFPTNIPIIPPKYCSPCPAKVHHHALQDRHTIGQFASKKIGHASTARFSRQHYTLKSREIEYFNINNICMQQVIDTTIDVNVSSQKNRCLRNSQAPKNRF